MKILIPFLVILTFSSSYGRVGETIDELKKRYGEPKQHVQEQSFKGGSMQMEHFIFEKDDIKIMVMPKNNVSVMESYHSSKKFSDDTLKALLEANKGTSEWMEPQNGITNHGQRYLEYGTKDKTRNAKYYSGADDGSETLNVELREVSKTPKGF